ncbi:hypothetical protein PRtIB026_A43960 [Pseudomonas sp. RtIB026]|nr:hypothetical protein PRtIB026_A43960 [Pseudomonas sp. RtIB026]
MCRERAAKRPRRIQRLAETGAATQPFRGTRPLLQGMVWKWPQARFTVATGLREARLTTTKLTRPTARL